MTPENRLVRRAVLMKSSAHPPRQTTYAVTTDDEWKYSSTNTYTVGRDTDGTGCCTVHGDVEWQTDGEVIVINLAID